MAMNFGSAGTAVSDLFGAIGDFQEASDYKKAASFANQNARIAGESGAVQEYMQQRQAYQTMGAQKSQVAAAGLSASGSAMDLLRSSTQQSSLAHQLITQQTAINVNGYREQADAMDSMASSATMAGYGGIAGSIASGLGAFGF